MSTGALGRVLRAAAGRIGPRRRSAGAGQQGSPTGRPRDLPRWTPCDDAGSALVEFLGVSLLLLIPTVYLVLVLGRLQAAAFAVDGAAREAVRSVIAAQAGDLDPAASASAAAGIALADQQIAASDPVALACDPGCSTPGALVVARVEVDVDLPLVPTFVRGAVPLSVPVTASAQGRLGEFVDGP